PSAAPDVRAEVDIPALLTKEVEVGDRRLGAGQDDEIGDGRRLAWTNEDKLDGRLQAQGVEVVEIGDMRQHRHGDGRRPLCLRAALAETERVFRRKTRRVGEKRQEAEGAPA